MRGLMVWTWASTLVSLCCNWFNQFTASYLDTSPAPRYLTRPQNSLITETDRDEKATWKHTLLKKKYIYNEILSLFWLNLICGSEVHDFWHRSRVHVEARVSTTTACYVMISSSTIRPKQPDHCKTWHFRGTSWIYLLIFRTVWTHPQLNKSVGTQC